MKNGLAMIVLGGALALALAPAASARDGRAGPTADVGTIACQSASQTTQMDISYFEAGTKVTPNTGTSGIGGDGGAGGAGVTFTPVFEIHAPLGSASEWGQALNTGSQFSSCTISVPGHGGAQTLTFQHLMVISVLSVGEREGDGPLPDYYTDVQFIAAPTGTSGPVGWDIAGSKTQ